MNWLFLPKVVIVVEKYHELSSPGFLDPTPQLFSFNNPYGTCKLCTGFGATLDYDPELIIPDPTRSIADGAVDPWTKPRYKRERAKLKDFTQERKVSLYDPW